jgi:hypothetical protein
MLCVVDKFHVEERKTVHVLILNLNPKSACLETCWRDDALPIGRTGHSHRFVQTA